MASGLITSWERVGKSVFDFLLKGFRITAEGD